MIEIGGVHIPNPKQADTADKGYHEKYILQDLFTVT